MISGVLFYSRNVAYARYDIWMGINVLARTLNIEEGMVSTILQGMNMSWSGPG